MTFKEQMQEKAGDDEPILIIQDKDGYIIEAGRPDCFKGRSLAKYIKDGYKITTITIKEYRDKKMPWVWDK